MDARNDAVAATGTAPQGSTAPRATDLSLAEQISLLSGKSAWETRDLPNRGVKSVFVADGPHGLRARPDVTDIGLTGALPATCFPPAVTLGSTWDPELLRQVGRALGREAADLGVDVILGPGMNIKRHPLGGRNFEYFSEDPLLTGKMASAVVAGAKAEGLVTTVKHFALNDQETNRLGVFTWAEEQAMREIYLKAFEIPLKETKAAGVMSAYNRLGTAWCGASSALLNDLLRGEWGFEGFVVSDFSSNATGTGYMSPVLAVYNGNDTMLIGIDLLSSPSNVLAVHAAYRRDPIGFGAALRTACKNICLMKMQSRAFLHPELTYDESLRGALTPPDAWDFKFPYTVSALRFALANVVSAFLWCMRAVS